MKTPRRLGVWVGIAVGLSSAACQQVRQPVAPVSVNSITYSECQTIDAAGGTVSAGPYSVTIPLNALVQSTEICIDQSNSDQWPVELGPSGQQFAVPVTLSINASGEANPSSLSIYWWNPTLQRWEQQTTTHSGNVLSTQISHFSRFTLG
jgi:hypothetical protein